MAELRAPEQNRLLGQLARMLRTTEGDIAAPEFLPKGLDVMGLVRQLMLPSAETVEKLSYGDPLFRMPTQSNIPITADREYLAEVLGMAPAVPAASRATTRLSNEAADQLVRAITGTQATAPQVLEAAGQMLPMSRMISPEVAAKALPNTKAVKNDEPVMLYSGSQNEIQQFDDRSGIAFPAWFTDRPDVASAYAVDPTRAARGERSPTVYPSYLDLQNPLVLDAKGAKWNNIKIRDKNIADELEIDAPVSTTFLAYAARQKGYDGVIIKNVKDNPNAEVSGVSDVYVPFNPEQIRSATGDPQMAGLLDQPAQSVVEAPKFEMPSFAALRPETEGDIDQIYDFVEQQAKKAGYRVKSGASNISGSRYLTITEDLPDDDIRDIELRISDHGDRHPFSDATEGKISIDPSRGGTDLEAALYELQEKGFNLLR